MTTSNAAADTAAKTGTEKAHEKLAEKRRALGRGLESLLPGPRVVPASPARPSAAPTLPQSTRKDGTPDSSSDVAVGRAGTPSLHLKLLTICRQRLRGKRRTASRHLSSRLTRSSRIRTRRGRSSSRRLWRSWRPRSRRREYCSRSLFGQCGSQTRLGPEWCVREARSGSS